MPPPPPPPPPPRRRALVIGAGPAGLIALRELRAAGVDARAVECAASLGGVYAAARVYAGAQLTTSSNMICFGCWPAPQPAAPVMWAAAEYVAYLAAFAAAFDLLPHISFNTRVERVELCGDGESVRVALAPAGADAAASRETAEAQLLVEHVVVASGLSSHAPPPAELLPGVAAFGGTLLHSSQLRGAEELAGRRVLVVGAGESGSDISLLAARVASGAALSTRAGPGFILPRIALGLPSDVDTCRAYHSLPRWLLRGPWHALKLWLEARCGAGAGDADADVLAAAAALNAARGRGPFERFGCKNTSIPEAMLRHGLRLLPGIARFERGAAVCVDGARFDCDVVVACTGYATRLPFLDAAHPALARQLRDVRAALYKRTFHPALGTRLTFCGLARPGLGAIPPLAELQARCIAAAIAGTLALPPPAAMRAAIAADAAADVAAFPDDAARIPALTDYARLMDALAGLLGVRPSLAQLLRRGELRVAWAVLFSSLGGAQFRLRGPGACWAAAAPALAAAPSLPAAVVLWEGAALLVCSALAALGVAACTPVMGWAV